MSEVPLYPVHKYEPFFAILLGTRQDLVYVLVSGLQGHLRMHGDEPSEADFLKPRMCIHLGAVDWKTASLLRSTRGTCSVPSESTKKRKIRDAPGL